MAEQGTIKIKFIRSVICAPEKHRIIVRRLGLRKINQVVERPDTPGFRGMVKKSCRIYWNWSIDLPQAERMASEETRTK
jgi:large subunit ribosomal protein L30